MIVKFSKSYSNILNIKKDFYKNNNINLKIALKINNFYRKQKKREKCKVCKKKIKDFFIKNTKESLYFLAKKYNLKIAGEWWFGTDIPDLYRSLLQSKNKSNEKIYNKNLNKYLFEIVDELQNVIDKKKMSSQVHMIFKKN